MRFTSSAEQDLVEARRWYERAQRGLGRELLSAVDQAIELLAEHATAFAAVHRGVRRVVLRRFPYALYYEIEESEVTIIGCFHARREPSTWIDRAEEHDEA